MRKILQRRSREACQVLRNKKARSLTRAQWLTHFSDGLKHNRTVRLLARRGETGPTDNADSLRPFFSTFDRYKTVQLFNDFLFNAPIFSGRRLAPPAKILRGPTKGAPQSFSLSHQTLIFFPPSRYLSSDNGPMHMPP